MNTPYFPFWPRFSIDDQGRAVVGPGSSPPFQRESDTVAAPAGSVGAGRAVAEPAGELAPLGTTRSRAPRGEA
jgi:hypothetical protein